jgi:DedD protein
MCWQERGPSVADNDNLELKKRSRRRLVGAAALALLAAIILPMIMDSEPQAPVRDIEVSIPDRDADSRQARPIAGRPAVADVGIAPAPQEQPPATGAGPQAEPPAVPPVATVAPSEQGPTPAKSQPPRPADAAPATPPRPASSAATPDDEAARVKAILEGRTGGATVETKGFVVQVGAFGDAGKAVTFSTDLKARGYAAYTEAAGTVTRVRVGPYATRDDAQKAAEALASAGIDGVVTSR